MRDIVVLGLAGRRMPGDEPVSPCADGFNLVGREIADGESARLAVRISGLLIVFVTYFGHGKNVTIKLHRLHSASAGTRLCLCAPVAPDFRLADITASRKTDFPCSRQPIFD